MDLYERIKHNFTESQELSSQTGNLLVTSIAEASELLVQSLLNSKKIISCGNAGCAALSQYFVSIMQNRFESERPSLPAIAIGSDTTTTSSIAIDSGFADIFAKPLKALGQQDDILFIMSSSGNSQNILTAAEVAHNRGLKIISLTGGDGGQLATELHGDDINICINHPSTTRVLELQLLIIHCLCDIVDRKLFANEE